MKILALALLLVTAPVAADAQYRWDQISVPQGIVDADVINSLHYVLISEGLATTYDGGKTWSRQGLQVGFDPMEIKCLGTSSIGVYGREYFYTPDNYVFTAGSSISVDSGKTWQTRMDPSTRRSDGGFKLVGRNGFDCYVGLFYYLTSQSGADTIYSSNIQTKILIDGYRSVTSVDMQDSIWLAVGLNDRLMRKLPGKPWTSTPLMWKHITIRPTIKSISAAEWVQSRNEVLLHSLDTGNTWDTLQRFPSRVKSMEFNGRHGALLLDSSDYVLTTDDAGRTWTSEGLDNAYNLEGIRIAYDSSMVVFNNRALIKRLPDSVGFRPVMNIKRFSDLGFVEANTPTPLQVVLRNVGDATLVIDSISLGRNITTITTSKSAIPAGDSALVQAEFTTSNLRGDTSRITFHTNTATGGEVAYVSGKARVPQFAYNTSLSFDTVEVGTRQVRWTHFKNVGATTAFITKIDFPDSNIGLSDGMDSVKPGATGKLAFYWSPTTPVILSGKVVLHTNSLLPDTILLSGISIASRSDVIFENWNRIQKAGGFLAHALAFSNTIQTVGVYRGTPDHQIRLTRWNSWGDSLATPFSESIKSLNLSSVNATRDSNGGTAIVWVDSPDSLQMQIRRQRATGEISAIQFKKNGTEGISLASPILLAIDPSDRLTVVSSGYKFYSTKMQYDWRTEPSQVRTSIVSGSGVVVADYFSNGDAEYLIQHPPEWFGGFDEATDLTVIGDTTLSFETQDDGYSASYDGSEPFRYDYRSRIFGVNHDYYHDAYDSSRSLKFAASKSDIIYTVRRSNDDVLVRRMTVDEKLLWNDSISKNEIKDVHRVLRSSTNEVYVVGSRQDARAGRNIVMFAYNTETGKQIWKREIDGPESSNDSVVKAMLYRDVPIVLVKHDAKNSPRYSLYAYPNSELTRKEIIAEDSLPLDIRDVDISPTNKIYIAGAAKMADSSWHPLLMEYSTPQSSVKQELAHDPMSLAISPNPASSYISVRIEGDDQVSAIKILSPLGSVVMSLDASARTDWNIPVKDLPAGVYFVEATGAVGRKMAKFTVAR